MVSGREPVEVKSNEANVKSDPGEMIIDKVPAILKKVHHLTTPFFQFCSQTQVSLPQTIFIKCSIFQKKNK